MLSGMLGAEEQSVSDSDNKWSLTVVGFLPGTVFGSSQQEVRLVGFLFLAIAC